MFRLKLIWLVVLIFCAGIALGQPKEASDALVKSREHKQLTLFSEKLGFVDTELPKGQASVLINLEGANLSVLVIGPISGNAKSYADVLQKIKTENGLNGEVVYSQEDDCAAAYWRATTGGFGKNYARLDFALKSAVAQLKGIEPNTKVGVAATKYSEPSTLSNPGYVTTRGLKIYDVTGFAPTGEGRMVAEVRVPWWITILLFVWFVLPILGSAVCYLYGLKLSKVTEKPMRERREAYAKGLRFGTFGVLGVHGLVAAGTLSTGILDPVAQVWLGQRFTASALAAMPIFMGLPIIMLLGLSSMEKKWFAATPDEAKLIEDYTEFQPRKEDQPKLRFWVMLLPIALLIPYALVFFFVPNINKLPIGQFLMFIPAFSILLTSFLPNLLKGPKFEATPRWAESYLPRAPAAYDRMKLQFPSLAPKQVKPMTTNMVPYNATIKGNIIEVTGAMAARFSDEELDFVMAHELAHEELGHLKARARTMLLVPILVFLMFLPLVFGISLSVSFNKSFLLSPFMLLLISMPVWSWYFRNKMQEQEYEADALAAQRTGKTAVACVALQKMAVQNTLPGFDQVDWHSTHPATFKRIERLQGIAGPSMPPRTA